MCNRKQARRYIIFGRSGKIGCSATVLGLLIADEKGVAEQQARVLHPKKKIFCRPFSSSAAWEKTAARTLHAKHLKGIEI